MNLVTPTLLLALVLCTAGCSVKVKSEVEPPPAPPPGTGQTVIAMSGAWKVTLSIPVQPFELGPPGEPGPFGLMPPLPAHTLAIADGQLVASGSEPMRVPDMPDAGEWELERYANFANGKVAYYALRRMRTENGTTEQQDLGIAIGTASPDRMLGYVQYSYVRDGVSGAGTYLIELRR